MKSSPSALRVLIPVGIGTSLSLLGDSSIYAVLPTHTLDAGVTLASVGILLSVNRWIRVFLNGPAGMLFDRWRRRPLFVASLFIGATSTAIYGFTQGFWPLFAGRLLWGLAWSGIWVGGNTIVLDITKEEDRGRWVGAYQLTFYLGAASGALLGGSLTDSLGYDITMRLHASLALAGAFIALFFLPETSRTRKRTKKPQVETVEGSLAESATRRQDFILAATLYGFNRFVIPGILISTFGLYLEDIFGDALTIAGRTIGVATLTGLGLGVSTLISMISAPASGSFSDRVSHRWKTVSAGLVPGIAGFGLLALSSPWMIPIGVPLISLTSGSNQGLATALVGDASADRSQSRGLGVLFTIGDMMSAAGPTVAYALLPILSISGLYLIAAILFAVMFLLSLRMVASKMTSPD